MRVMLLASVSLLFVGGTAFAQNSTGSPMSGSATHTSSANTAGAIAPRLPISADDASVNQFLMHAQTALKRGHTGEAQEALERAETRLLSRSTEATQATTPDADPRVASVEAARQALGRGDRHAAMDSINSAMMTSSDAATGAPMTKMPMTNMPMAPAANGMSPGAFVSPAPAAGVKPGTLGGIANGVGTPNGTGLGTRSKPQASFSGPGPAASPGGTSGAPAIGGAPLIPPGGAPTTTP